MTNCRCDPFTGDECQACKNKLLVDKAEYERLKRLEAAAIEWFTADGEARYEASHKWWPLVIEAAEKAQKQ